MKMYYPSKRKSHKLRNTRGAKENVRVMNKTDVPKILIFVKLKVQYYSFQKHVFKLRKYIVIDTMPVKGLPLRSNWK